MRHLLLALALLLSSATAARAEETPAESTNLLPGEYPVATFVDGRTGERLTLTDEGEGQPEVRYGAKKKSEVVLKVVRVDRAQRQVTVAFPKSPTKEYVLTVHPSGRQLTNKNPDGTTQVFYLPQHVTEKFRLEGTGCESVAKDAPKAEECKLLDATGTTLLTVRTCGRGEAKCEGSDVTLGKLQKDRQYLLETENPMEPSRLTVHEYLLGPKKLNKVGDFRAKLDAQQKRYGRDLSAP
jgi:hypothetical protein